MKSTLNRYKAALWVCLGGALICSLISCAQPEDYWVKFGVPRSQIKQDSFVCAAGAAEKRDVSPHSGQWFYFAPLNRKVYERCMESRGYRLVTVEELQQRIHTTTDQNSHGQGAASKPSLVPSYLQHLAMVRPICETAVGKEGDVETCVRWMTNPNSLIPTAQDEVVRDSIGQREITASIGKETKNYCLRHDPYDITYSRVVLSECDTEK